MVLQACVNSCTGVLGEVRLPSVDRSAVCLNTTQQYNVAPERVKCVSPPFLHRYACHSSTLHRNCLGDVTSHRNACTSTSQHSTVSSSYYTGTRVIAARYTGTTSAASRHTGTRAPPCLKCIVVLLHRNACLVAPSHRPRLPSIERFSSVLARRCRLATSARVGSDEGHF